MIRVYSGIVGLVLSLLGLAGLTSITGLNPPANIFHLGVGGIFLYLGFFQRDVAIVRTVVGGMGVLLLVVKGAIILVPLWWGEPPLLTPIEITCLVVGLLSILATKYLRDGKLPSGD